MARSDFDITNTLASVDAALARTEGQRGATEPRLTGAIAILLAADRKTCQVRLKWTHLSGRDGLGLELEAGDPRGLVVKPSA